MFSPKYLKYSTVGLPWCLTTEKAGEKGPESSLWVPLLLWGALGLRCPLEGQLNEAEARPWTESVPVDLTVRGVRPHMELTRGRFLGLAHRGF